MNTPKYGTRAEMLAAFHRHIDVESGKHDVRIRVVPNLNDFADVDRGGGNRIFEPSRKIGPSISLLAVHGSDVVATWACTVFDTGIETMAEFLRHSNFYRDDGEDDWIFRGAALDLAKQMRGTIAYCGGLWVRYDHRGSKGGTLGPWWTKTAGLLGRSIAAETWNPDWFWLISDKGPVADKCAPRYGLKQIAQEVDWLVGGQSYDGLKVLGVQDREHLTQSVRDRLAQ